MLSLNDRGKNHTARALLEKVTQMCIRDRFNSMRDSQDKETGYVPNSAPWCPGAGGGVAWRAAMSIMPWEYYMNYGDKKVIAENYNASKRQIDYMLSLIHI